MSDDFDRLGTAVARVLRDAFATAEELRREGAADADGLARSVAAAVEGSVREALGLQSNVKAEAEGVLAAVRSTTSSASVAVSEVLEGAQVQAAAIRRAAEQDAAMLRERLEVDLARVTAVAEAEHSRFEHALGTLTQQVRAAVDALEDDAGDRRRLAVERAKAEASSILRQARLHHRSAAAEVDRMIEAAAAEAAALRQAALEDALRITERVGGVVDLGPPRAVAPAPSRRRRAG